MLVARRGRRFRIVADRPTRSRARAKAFFQVTDPQVLESGWTWERTIRAGSLTIRHWPL